MIYSLGPFCALVRLSHLYDRPIVQTTGLFCTHSRTEHTHTQTMCVCVCGCHHRSGHRNQMRAAVTLQHSHERAPHTHTHPFSAGPGTHASSIHPPLRCACACCRCNATVRNNGNERHEWSVWRKSVVRLMTPAQPLSHHRTLRARISVESIFQMLWLFIVCPPPPCARNPHADCSSVRRPSSVSVSNER